MARLRDPETGCPWDKEQSFRTIAPYTIEESYEVAEAIEEGDHKALKEELGDLLFQVVFYAQMGREEGLFDFNDITQAITDKMIRRHPHVFADTSHADIEAQTHAWEAQKAAERREKMELKGQEPSLLDDVPAGEVGDWERARRQVGAVERPVTRRPRCLRRRRRRGGR